MTTEQAQRVIFAIQASKILKYDAIEALVLGGADPVAIIHFLKEMAGLQDTELSADSAQRNAHAHLRELKEQMSELWVKRDRAQTTAEQAGKNYLAAVTARAEASKQFTTLLEELTRPPQQPPVSRISTPERDFDLGLEDIDFVEDIDVVEIEDINPGKQLAELNGKLLNEGAPEMPKGA